MTTSLSSIPALEDGGAPTFEQLYVQYREYVGLYIAHTTYCAVYSNADMVDDIVQEVFLKVWRIWARTPQEPVSSALIFTIAHTTCIDWLRKKQRTLRRHEILAERHEACLVAPDRLADIEEVECVRLAWDTLRPRDAFALKYLAYGYSYREVAAMMGASETAYKTWVRRARQALRAAMQEQDAS